MSSPTTPSMKSSPSRRDFLKTSVALGGSAALLPLARSAHAAGDDAIKVGLIGCGGRGSGAALQALSADKGAKLVAMADIFDDHLRAARTNLKKQCPDQVAVDDDRCFVGFDGYQGVVEAADVVLIACASRFHPAYMQAAVEAGKHVFVEKPQAIDPVGVRTLIEATKRAEQKKLSVVAGLHLRYDPANREAIKRVKDGAIGDVVAVEVNFMRNPYRVNKRNPAWDEMEWQCRNWYHFTWLSGDDVVQSLVHSIDIAQDAIGDPAPLYGHALGGRSASFGPEFGDTFDHASPMYEYPNGMRMYGFDRTQYGCHGGFSTILLGSKGRCELIRRQAIVGETNWRYEGPRVDGHRVEQQELLASIRNGQPINNGHYMAQSTMIGILGQMAAYTGKLIKWDEALNSDFRYPPEKVDFDVEPPVKPAQDATYPVPVPGMTKLA